MLLKKLVEIESPTGCEDALKDFVKEYLENLGYRIVEGEHFISTKSHSELIVSTHLDTTAVKTPFSTDGVYAYGTGVCDAKASIAAMLEAAEREDIVYTMAFFCDEEEGGKGSMEFVEKWRRGRMAIVMEPTEMKIASRLLGSLDLYVDVRGKASHASRPEFGINAIDRAFELLEILRSKFKVTPLMIKGGGKDYVTPTRCVMKLDILFEPEKKIDEILGELKFVDEYGSWWIDFAYEGYESREVAKVLEKALMAAGIAPEHTTMPSWTDALNLKERFDVAVFGPGELELCHTTAERVRLEDISKTTQVLLKLNEIFK